MITNAASFVFVLDRVRCRSIVFGILWFNWTLYCPSMTGISSLKWFLIPVLVLEVLSSTRLVEGLEECTSDLACRAHHQGRHAPHEGLIRCIMGQCTWLSKASEDDEADDEADDDASQSQLDSLGTNEEATAVEMIRDLYFDPEPTHSQPRKGSVSNANNVLIEHQYLMNLCWKRSTLNAPCPSIEKGTDFYKSHFLFCHVHFYFALRIARTAIHQIAIPAFYFIHH